MGEVGSARPPQPPSPTCLQVMVLLGSQRLPLPHLYPVPPQRPPASSCSSPTAPQPPPAAPPSHSLQTLPCHKPGFRCTEPKAAALSFLTAQHFILLLRSQVSASTEHEIAGLTQPQGLFIQDHDFPCDLGFLEWLFHQ